jgi:type IV secretory pathway TrbL component
MMLESDTGDKPSASEEGLRDMMAFFGLLLIVLGILIIVLPQFLKLLVGGAFILAGVGAFVMGLRIKQAVTYRRIDATWEQPE